MMCDGGNQTICDRHGGSNRGCVQRGEMRSAQGGSIRMSATDTINNNNNNNRGINVKLTVYVICNFLSTNKLPFLFIDSSMILSIGRRIGRHLTVSKSRRGGVIHACVDVFDILSRRR